jgi:cytochrome c-type biogenesis protein
MNELALAAGGAFGLGFSTAISPCLMATNIAAITFIARKLNDPKMALLSGLFYIVGQAIAYVVLGGLLVKSLLSVPTVSLWLQDYFLLLLGPILIVSGMFLLELLTMHFGGGKLKEKAQDKASNGGLWFSAVLGIVFAMSFCPTTAALFFGGLIPLAVTHESVVFLPFVYALGVAVPVIVFALLIVLAASNVGKVFTNVQRVERWARFGTGTIFLVIGIYFTVRFTLKLL